MVVMVENISLGRDGAQTLSLTDRDGNKYITTLYKGWTNYGRYNVGDEFLIKSCRLFEWSADLGILKYLRIKH